MGDCCRCKQVLGQSCYISVLMLPDMCPHAATYCYICVLMLPDVSSYCYICDLILPDMCHHTAIYVSSCCQICVLILLDMCPHAAIYVSSYFCETAVAESRRLGGGLLWIFRPLVSELFSVCVCVFCYVCVFCVFCVCLCVSVSVCVCRVPKWRI